jgi:hypothetical protein
MATAALSIVKSMMLLQHDRYEAVGFQQEVVNVGYCERSKCDATSIRRGLIRDAIRLMGGVGHRFSECPGIRAIRLNFCHHLGQQ